MENLHPAAQITAIIVIGIVVCVFILSISGYFDKD